MHDTLRVEKKPPKTECVGGASATANRLDASRVRCCSESIRKLTVGNGDAKLGSVSDGRNTPNLGNVYTRKLTVGNGDAKLSSVFNGQNTPNLGNAYGRGGVAHHSSMILLDIRDASVR